jgi:hypothetical protein
MRPILISVLLMTLAAPAAAADKPAYLPPHNKLGQPDFGGVWSFNSLTRLERPAAIKNLVMTEDEAKTHTPASVLPHDSVGTSDTEAHDELNYTWARLGGEIRSSWLTVPATGKLPYRPDAQAKLRSYGGASNPEDRSIYERCLSMPQNGPPILNAAYNNNIRVMQTKDFIILQPEANHEVRTIRLKTRTHLSPLVPQWTGDSVGWFEGDTLVIETTGFEPHQSDRRSAMTPVIMSPDAKVTERLTRISKDQIRYSFEVNDPAMFTETWKGEIPWNATTGPMYEYACHEGNYGLANILSGARYEEQQRAKASPPSR